MSEVDLHHHLPHDLHCRPCPLGRIAQDGGGPFRPSLPSFSSPAFQFYPAPHGEGKRGPLKNLIPLFFLPSSPHVLRAGPRHLAVLLATRVVSPRPCLA